MGFPSAFSVYAFIEELPIFLFPILSETGAEIFILNPFFSFVGVPSSCPTLEVPPQSVADVTEGFFAAYSSVVVGKTSEKWF